jgi:hypothetical protein
MNASELRIGSFIDVFGICEVIAIDSEKQKVKVKRPGKHEGHWLIESAPLSSEDVKPIPLNEEWLIKLGAEKCTCGGFKVSVPKFHFDKDEKMLVYVHQLQNRFYSMTGQELITK